MADPTHQSPPAGPINTLLVGAGGREHSLGWKLKQSPRLGRLYLTHPDNPGLAAIGTPVDVPFDTTHPFRLQRFCDKHDIGLVVIGPEEPLAQGLADALAATNRVVFGPSKEAARLEADKAWAREIMHSAAVPMADGRAFSDPDAAKNFLSTRESPYVVKASGLAKGKGVIVPESLDEALAAIDRIMIKKEFGDAGRTVVIEERLKGREVSVMALVDGRNIFVMEPCQDHKRLGDNDTGPNTGGMGAFSPGGDLDDAMRARIEREVLVPTIDTLRRDGIEFRGVLYAGIMITPGGPKVLEFNVRFGDPECQALMVRLDADLVDVLMATGSKRLHEVEIAWRPGASVCIVLAARGYPDKPNPPPGQVIEGLEEAARVEGVTIFHAATKSTASGGEPGRPRPGRVVAPSSGAIDAGRGALPGSSILTSGGRILNVTAVGESLAEARERAYRACEMIRFEGKVMRGDIGD